MACRPKALSEFVPKVNAVTADAVRAIGRKVYPVLDADGRDRRRRGEDQGGGRAVRDGDRRPAVSNPDAPFGQDLASRHRSCASGAMLSRWMWDFMIDFRRVRRGPIEVMRLRIHPLLAGIALTAVLSCSALGVCWRQVIRAAHDCCASEKSAAPAKACASPVAHEMTVKLVPPGGRGAAGRPRRLVDCQPLRTDRGSQPARRTAAPRAPYLESLSSPRSCRFQAFAYCRRAKARQER